MKKRIAIIDDTHNGVILLKLESEVLMKWEHEKSHEIGAKTTALQEARAAAFTKACELTADNIPVFCFEQKF